MRKLQFTSLAPFTERPHCALPVINSYRKTAWCRGIALNSRSPFGIVQMSLSTESQTSAHLFWELKVVSN